MLRKDCLFALATILTSVMLVCCSFQRDFSETDWKADQSVRFSMTDSLIRKLEREKPGKEQVDELLGPKKDLDDFQSDIRSYFLKGDSILGTDASYLVVEFDGKLFKSASIAHQN